MRMEQKVAIVTGGGKGLGKAISLAFAAEGAKVVIAARDLASTEQTAREIESRGGTADALATDVRYEEQIKRMVSHTLDRFGRIDVLVNNSAVGGPTINVIDMDLKVWNDVVATNLTAPMLCAREVLKSMIAARKGTIITIRLGGWKVRLPHEKSLRGNQAGGHCPDRDARHRSGRIRHPRKLHQSGEDPGRTHRERRP